MGRTCLLSWRVAGLQTTLMHEKGTRIPTVVPNHLEMSQESLTMSVKVGIPVVLLAALSVRVLGVGLLLCNRC